MSEPKLFAVQLGMDDETLSAAFRSHTEGQSQFTRRMAITIAHSTGATPRAVIIRLEQIGLLKPGSWRWFVRNGGITKAQISEVCAALVEARHPASAIRARKP